MFYTDFAGNSPVAIDSTEIIRPFALSLSKGRREAADTLQIF